MWIVAWTEWMPDTRRWRDHWRLHTDKQEALNHHNLLLTVKGVGDLTFGEVLSHREWDEPNSPAVDTVLAAVSALPEEERRRLLEAAKNL